MILDEEVFAVVMAIIVVGSVFSIAQVLKPDVVEPFTAIGLLNEDCKIGDYPETVVVGENITLCIFVHNYMGYPIYYSVVYKIGTNSTLPSLNMSSPEKPVASWKGFFDHGENTTFKVIVQVSKPGEKIALIFELWIYDPEKDLWTYTGRWVHLYVDAVEAPVK